MEKGDRRTVEDVLASQVKFDPLKEERVVVNVPEGHELEHLNGMQGTIVPLNRGRTPYVDFGSPVGGRVLYSGSESEPAHDAEGWGTPECCLDLFEDLLERNPQRYEQR